MHLLDIWPDKLPNQKPRTKRWIEKASHMKEKTIAPIKVDRQYGALGLLNQPAYEGIPRRLLDAALPKAKAGHFSRRENPQKPPLPKIRYRLPKRPQIKLLSPIPPKRIHKKKCILHFVNAL